MYFNFPDVDFHDNQVRFTTSSEDETPRVEFSLSESLLKQKMSFIDQPSQGDVSALLQILTENRTKTHCPWIYLYYSLNCTYMGSRFSQFLQIEFRNIVYVDNNGWYIPVRTHMGRCPRYVPRTSTQMLKLTRLFHLRYKYRHSIPYPVHYESGDLTMLYIKKWVSRNLVGISK